MTVLPSAAFVRYDTDNPGAQPQRVSNSDDAANTGAATNRYVHRIEVWRGQKKFECIARNATNELTVIGRYHKKVFFLCNALRLDTCLVEVFSVLNESAPES